MNAKSFNGLEVTEIRIKLADDPLHPNLKALVVVCLNDAIVIRNLKLIQPAYEGGRTFISFPAKTLESGISLDMVHTTGPAARAWFEQVVLDEYRRELAYRAQWLKNTEPARLQEAS